MWICPHCGTRNTGPRIVCIECGGESRPGRKDGPGCPVCHDTGFVNDAIDRQKPCPSCGWESGPVCKDGPGCPVCHDTGFVNDAIDRQKPCPSCGRRKPSGGPDGKRQ